MSSRRSKRRHRRRIYDAEQRVLRQINKIQNDGVTFRGYHVVKALRTFDHPSLIVRALDGSQKIDIIVVFERILSGQASRHLVFAIQVKSRLAEIRQFRETPFAARVWSLLARRNECVPRIRDALAAMFACVVIDGLAEQKYLRTDIALSDIFYTEPSA